MYMKFPLDFFATVIPAPIKDNHTIHIDLTEPATQSVEEENGSEGTRPEKE
jgi:hypothetical protein